MFPNKVSKAAAILFVISLGFNIFFVIAAARARAALKEMRTPEGRVEMVADRLKLDGDQKAQVSRLMKELWAGQGEARQANAAAKNEFWAEVTSDRPDTVKLDGLSDQVADQVAAATRTSIEKLLEIMKELNPEQRQELARMIQEKNSWKDELASGGQ